MHRLRQGSLLPNNLSYIYFDCRAPKNWDDPFSHSSVNHSVARRERERRGSIVAIKVSAIADCEWCGRHGHWRPPSHLGNIQAFYEQQMATAKPRGSNATYHHSRRLTWNERIPTVSNNFPESPARLLTTSAHLRAQIHKKIILNQMTTCSYDLTHVRVHTYGNAYK